MLHTVYNQLLKAGNSGASFHFWFRLKAAIAALFNDPPCRMVVHGRSMHMPLSHALPFSMSLHPFYDRLPSRLSDFVHEKYGYLKVIDVGANIGDTIAGFYRHDDDSFLAIEPNPHFLGYLARNFGDDPNVHITSCMCTSGETEAQYRIEEHVGTASFKKAETGESMPSKSIDGILSEQPAFLNANVMKIDTDGYDLEVIAGAGGLISKSLPIILFECFDNGSPSYGEDCLAALSRLGDAGYHSFLLYDNLGYLMGLHSLQDLSHFRQLLAYQISSGMGNTDVLVMTKEDAELFYQKEKSAFERMPARPAEGASGCHPGSKRPDSPERGSK